jgi:hypothetical protein
MDTLGGLPDNDKSIKFDLPAELKEQAEDAARRSDLSVAQYLRALLRSHLGGQGYVQGQGVNRAQAAG